ncbi:LysR family transcriptional regulator substrate-binding protein [Streptomyces solicathayae]|uniref:LysR family transcriptional regulator substrate-binding protein n=1 Tax=Streptomyces solicathayae TaxID=3081768 RepID=A0ABZ0LKV8_9ACTN|nr:LysR family transcriptional regulator substrate-binding protein [Streptomyces sp. HUAS YS2]WOX20140.1 LysR family transcriptional regulator substrate-binding protein [Streptomyces sp. HUAS YS2]
MTRSEDPTADSPSFRLAYVPGVTPAKWVRIWNERLPGIPLLLTPVAAADALDVLRGRGADAGFVRMPVDDEDLSAIPLYTETTVVVVPKDHLVAAADEISVDELADEILLHPLDDTLDWERPPGRPAFERPATTADAIELVAAGIGLLVVPQSLARLHHRKDLTYRTVTGTPQSRIALSWPKDETTDMVEDFIGIVRGRTVNSSRGRRADAEESKGQAGKPAAGRKPGAGRATGKAGGKATGKTGGKTQGGRPAARGARAGGAGGTKGGGKPGKPRRRS